MLLLHNRVFNTVVLFLTPQVRESDGRDVESNMKINLEGLIIKWAHQVESSNLKLELPSSRWTRCSQRDPRMTS